METGKLLNADLLDIIFEGRNKEYGAYDLRKNYNRRPPPARNRPGSQ
jgi:protein TonB